MAGSEAGTEQVTVNRVDIQRDGQHHVYVPNGVRERNHSVHLEEEHTEHVHTGAGQHHRHTAQVAHQQDAHIGDGRHQHVEKRIQRLVPENISHWDVEVSKF